MKYVTRRSWNRQGIKVKGTTGILEWGEMSLK